MCRAGQFRLNFYIPTWLWLKEWSDSNKGVLSISQSSSNTEISSSYCLVLYLGYSLKGLAEKQSLYSTAPADWVRNKSVLTFTCLKTKIILIVNWTVWNLFWHYIPEKGWYAVKQSTKPIFLLRIVLLYTTWLIYFKRLPFNHIYQPLRSGRIWHKVSF